VPLDQKMPDHSTIWRFRERLAASGVATAAFNCVTAQIEKAGLVLKKGTLIDASLVPAAVNKPEPPASGLPPDPDGRPASKLVRSALDPDAAWTKKNGVRYFGYKAHVALDMESRIIRRLAFTPANINDTSCADALICGDERTVYADKAYDSKARSAALKARGIRNGIMRRWHWSWRPPSRWERRRNELLVKRRAPIEPLFALLKNVYGFARARYRGLVRNAAALQLAAAAINIKRWTMLTSVA
jgi:IS5 family transposase